MGLLVKTYLPRPFYPHLLRVMLLLKLTRT
jgi:hypothetical protein